MATLFTDTPPKKNIAFLDQIAVHHLVETLFGARNAEEYDDSGDNDDDDNDGNREALLGLSALSIDDCFSTTPISPDTWQHMLGRMPEQSSEQDQSTAADQEEKDRLPNWTKDLPELNKNEEGGPYLDPAVHVAIDRWTGGASDGALYSVLEPWNFEWNSLCLTLDLNRFARHHNDVAQKQEQEDVALAAVTLLLAVLGDFVNGEVPLGFAVNRGCGAVECEGITVLLPEPQGYYTDLVADLLNKLGELTVQIENGKLHFTGADDLDRAWRAYLSKNGLSGTGVAA